MGTPDETWASLAHADPSATIRPEPSLSRSTAVSTLLSKPGGRADLDFGDTIGTGGMGVVRTAEQPRLGRVVAVKSLRGGTTREDATRRLVEEAWITGALEHPNIVPIYDIAIDDDQQAHILMKRISGIGWESIMDDASAVATRFGAQDLLGWNLTILATVCNAVHFAHSRGVLHRDLKPDNVMIGEFGEVYLVDWGIAVALESDGRLPTLADKRIAGTPRYMAPEMVDGRVVGVPTDVYLLGGLLHRILTGLPPHRGWSIQEILANIESFAPTFPDDAPEALCDLVRAATAHDPALRMQSAEQFRQAVSIYLERRSSNELTEQAEHRRKQLQHDLERKPDRTALYASLAACRFGYGEALRTWPDNPAALAGWRLVLTAMLRYELACRDPRAARALIADLEPTDPQLERQLITLEAEIEAEQVAQRGLALDRDLRIGARTRALFAGVLGVLWVSASVFGYVWLETPSLEMMIAYSVAITVGVALFSFWGRQSLLATHLNRATAGMVLICTCSQTLLCVLLWQLEVDPSLAPAFLNFLFAAVTACAVLLIDKRIVFTMVAFLVAAFLCSADLPHGLLFTAAAVGAFTANVLALWLPGLPTAPMLRPDS